MEKEGPKKNSGFTEKLQHVNSKIIDHAIFISLLFSFPAVIGVFMHAINTGLNLLLYLHFFQFALLVLLYITRKKSSCKFRTISYFTLVITVISPYMIKVGVLGYWIVELVIIILLISIFYNKKHAYIALIIIAAGLLFLALLYLNGNLRINFEIESYVKSYNIWIAMIVTFVYVSILVISINEMQRSFFVSSIKESTFARDKALENEKKFKQIFNSSTDGIMISDKNSNILEANIALSRILGIPVNKLKSKKTIDFVSQEYAKILKERVLSYEKQNLPLIELPVTNGKNEDIHIEVNTISIDYNEGKALLSIIRDISARKDTEGKILKSVIRAEERERSRFAKEIHDGVGPLLSAAKIYTDAFKNAESDIEKDFIVNKLNEIVNEAIISTKEISNNLSPHILRNFGLKGAVESFFLKIKQISSIDFNFKTNLEKRLNQDIEATFYRIIVELINNSIKYANAKSIFIELIEYNTFLSLAYADDGKGFDCKTLDEKTTGFGLSNIKNRVQSLNGKIKIWSKPGKGFKADIRIKSQFFG